MDAFNEETIKQSDDMIEERRQTLVLEERKSKPKKKGKGGIKVFLIILGLCLILVLITAVGFNDTDGYGDGDPYIATMYVEGTIQSGNVDSFGRALGYQHEWTLSRIDDLIYDDNNEGMILYVDSPGGGVYESDELYLKIKEYQECTGNPVYAYMGSMAASGGYYISAPADKIFANRNTWTGSIGITIGTIYDVSGFLERYGIKSETITSGVNKAMGSSIEPMSVEQRKIWQDLVDEAYQQFTDIVAEGRGLPIERVRQIADGRIYSAMQAQELGLVDKIGTMDDAVADMRKTYRLGYCSIVNVIYEEHSVLSGILGGMFSGQNQEAAGFEAAGSEAAAVLSLVESGHKFPISYTCEWLMN